MPTLLPFRAGDVAGVYDGAENRLLGLDAIGEAAIAHILAHHGDGAAGVRAALTPTFGEGPVLEVLRELAREGLFGPARPLPPPPAKPLPLRTMILHLAQDCNMACTYCYADEGLYGGARKRMPIAVAEQALDHLMEHGDDKVHVTFFGGEPLLNWPVLRHAVEVGLEKAKACGKRITFSFTTNGSLLTEERVDWLAAHRVGVSVSLDGPDDLQDANRPFRGGKPSAAVVGPKVAMLLARHRTRPIGARVTLTHGNTDAIRIFDHLIGMGFAEVGLSPVTSDDPAIYLSDEETRKLLADMALLAERTVEAALEDRYLGFSNVINLWQEIYAGTRKAYACGAGLGMLSVSVDGVFAPCHRFNGDEDLRFGDLAAGLDRAKHAKFLEEVHLDRKPGCKTCFAQSLCSGGCYHEAKTRHGDHAESNHHACDFVRTWITTAITTYARVWAANPGFLEKIGARGSYHEVAVTGGKL
jgi:uncharacterized protein